MRSGKPPFAALCIYFLLAPIVAHGNTCMESNTRIGVIESVKTDERGVTIELAHADTFNPQPLSTNLVNVDAYAELVAGFRTEGLRVPVKFRQVQPSAAEEKRKRDVVAKLFLPAAQASGLPLRKGNIVVVGPPGGGFCVLYGFTGIFTPTGKIASSLSSSDIVYGAESLKISGGKDYACVKKPYESDCQRELTYAIGEKTISVKPGETKDLPGTKFLRIHLLESTNSTQVVERPEPNLGPHMVQRVDFRAE